MELILFRTYYPGGTNGELYHLGTLVCYTIELPWRDNEVQRSCIPEGRYRLRRRCSKRYGWHLLVAGVPGRSLILVHPANDAGKELRGCLAPVSRLTGRGTGLQSRVAMCRLMMLAEGKEPIYLTIKTKSNEYHKQDTGTDTKVFPYGAHDRVSTGSGERLYTGSARGPAGHSGADRGLPGSGRIGGDGRGPDGNGKQ